MVKKPVEKFFLLGCYGASISYRRFGTNYRARPERLRNQPVIFLLEYC